MTNNSFYNDLKAVTCKYSKAGAKNRLILLKVLFSTTLCNHAFSNFFNTSDPSYTKRSLILCRGLCRRRSKQAAAYTEYVKKSKVSNDRLITDPY